MQKVLQVLWHVRMYYELITTLRAIIRQTKQKRDKQFDKKTKNTKQEIKVMVDKKRKKALKQKKRKHVEQLPVFEKNKCF